MIKDENTNGFMKIIQNISFSFSPQDSHPFPSGHSEYDSHFQFNPEHTLSFQKSYVCIYFWYLCLYILIAHESCLTVFRARQFFQELQQPPAQSLRWPAHVSLSSFLCHDKPMFVVFPVLIQTSGSRTLKQMFDVLGSNQDALFVSLCISVCWKMTWS